MTVLMTHVREQLGEDDLTPLVAPHRAQGPTPYEDHIEAVLVQEAVLVEPGPEPMDGSLLGPPPKIEYRPAHVGIAITMAMWLLVCGLTVTVAWALWP